MTTNPKQTAIPRRQQSPAKRKMHALNLDLQSLLRAAADEVELLSRGSAPTDEDAVLVAQQLTSMFERIQRTMRSLPTDSLQNDEHCHRCFEPQQPGSLIEDALCDSCAMDRTEKGVA